MTINGKVAFVTGAAQGIGQAIATRLASDGADLALFDLKEDGLQETKTKVEELGRRAIAIGGDVTDKAGLEAAVDRTVAELGGFDIMVNNAGIASVTAVEDITEADFDRMFAINVKGVCCSASRSRPPSSRSSATAARSSPRPPSPRTTRSR